MGEVVGGKGEVAHQARQQAVVSQMPPSALLCCSGLRAQWADVVKVGVVIKRPAVQASDPARQGYGGGKAQ